MQVLACRYNIIIFRCICYVTDQRNGNSSLNALDGTDGRRTAGELYTPLIACACLCLMYAS